MELAGWISGVLLIVFGILGWKSPHLINIFSKEEKEKIDLKGVGKLFRNIFIPIGIIQIAATYFFHRANMLLMSGVMLLFLVLIGIFVFALKAEKFKNKK